MNVRASELGIDARQRVGTIKHQKADRICKCLLCEASEKLHRRLRETSDGRCSQRAKCEIALCNDQRHYVVDCGHRSHRHCCIDDNCGGNDRRSSYGALKRYRSERPACNWYCPHDNQPRERKSLAGRQQDSRGKGSPCELHSYSGRPAKHEWAECSESPANQKKPTAKRAEAYYTHDKRHPASDAASLSKHRTALASDNSSKGYSSCLDHSNDEDNFAVAISALPCKQAKRNILPPKR